MHFYNLYGSNLSSEIEIPFLEEIKITKAVDVEIAISNSVGNQSLMSKDRKDNIINLQHSLIFSRKNKLAFEIIGGKKIIIHKLCKNLNNNEISIIMLNVPLGYCLYQQKKLVLHSCGISDSNGAYLFMGESGTGKSSLAASLLEDFNFITEDVAVLEFKNNLVNIFQGPPYVKLEESILDDFRFSKSSSIKILSDRLNRTAFKTKLNFKKVHKIKKIYVLEWGDDFSISNIENKKLLATYLLNTFTAYPYESCKESSKISLSHFNELVKEIDFFLLTRDKKRRFKDNGSILKHILSDK